jgi:alpha-amylase/alpha-mannosidase (GH57 family)
MALSEKLAFGWVLHQHQPVGNFPWVFEQVYTVCYAPLLDLFERHPSVRVTLHYSGPLLDWLLAEHPNYVERLAILAQRGQVEIMTGGYYEPILPILPPGDLLGQITKMNGAIRELFGTDPAGLWLPERVWEPSLPAGLHRAQVSYTVTDDTHFLMAGLSPDQFYGYYITEDQGLPLAVFPNPKLMREILPWSPIPEIAERLHQIARTSDGQPRIVIAADDGEKFGSWPKTYQTMWKQGYMEAFARWLEDNQDWLATVKLDDYRRTHDPLGRVYLPTASYSEMMEWALPAERSAVLESVRQRLERAGDREALAFLHGGSWRNFAAKYPEANNIQKKMLRVSRLVAASDNAAAREALWRGQCNCGYWHGVFGGIYLADIRSAIYQNLIRAESLAGIPSTLVTTTDFDADGHDELLIEGPVHNIYLAPHDGGTIFEWDFKPVPFNVADTLARRLESYHRKLLSATVKIVPPDDPFGTDRQDEEGKEEEVESIHELVWAKEPGLEGLLHYDAERRAVLRERFLPLETILASLETGEYRDLGDFVSGRYEATCAERADGSTEVILKRTGTILGQPVTMEKRLILEAAGATIHVSYALTNQGDVPVSARFAVESNFGLLGGGGNPGAWYEVDGKACGALDSRGEHTDAREVRLINAGVGIAVAIASDELIGLWRWPVETVSNSEGGFERNYLCSSVVLHQDMTLEPGAAQQLALHLSIEHHH